MNNLQFYYADCTFTTFIIQKLLKVPRNQIPIILWTPEGLVWRGVADHHYSPEHQRAHVYNCKCGLFVSLRITRSRVPWARGTGYVLLL